MTEKPVLNVIALAEPFTQRFWQELQSVDVAVRREAIEQLGMLEAIEREVEEGFLDSAALREPISFGLTEYERRELDRALAEYRENPKGARPWKEVWKELKGER